MFCRLKLYKDKIDNYYENYSGRVNTL